MNNNRPLIVIDDDQDDQDLLAEIFRKLNYKNQVLFFDGAYDALNLLTDQYLSLFNSL